jgi:hypothetical protein
MKTYDSHKSTVEVRQGDRNPTNRYPLIIGLAVVIVAFALIYFWFAFFGGGHSINSGY